MKRLLLVAIFALSGGIAGSFAGAIASEVAYHSGLLARAQDEWREVAIILGVVFGGIVGLAMAELLLRLWRGLRP